MRHASSVRGSVGSDPDEVAMARVLVVPVGVRLAALG